MASAPSALTAKTDAGAWWRVFLEALIWTALYLVIEPLSRWIAFGLVGLARGSHLGDAVAFFFYDVPKILLLLSGMIFVIAVVRSFFSAERARRLLSGKRVGLGNVLAATLGIVTPFCSCSAVPLFIGFVESGIPLGVTFSFLIAAPVINEVALILLFGMFGWRVAALYVSSGLTSVFISMSSQPSSESSVPSFTPAFDAALCAPSAMMSVGQKTAVGGASSASSARMASLPPLTVASLRRQ